MFDSGTRLPINGALDLKAHDETPNFCSNPGHNVNTERVFTLTQSQWTKERNKLHVEYATGILFQHHYFKHMSCKEFHFTHLSSHPNLSNAISSSEKCA